jgi:hypothetical protein
MPLKSHIFAICDQLAASHTNVYGTAKEINYKADKANSDLFICLFPLTPVTINLTKSGGANNCFDFYMEFLYKTKFERTSEDNEIYITNALDNINKFLGKLREYRVGNNNLFEWRDDTQATARPTYSVYDANFCGMSLTFKVKLMGPVIAPQC